MYEGRCYSINNSRNRDALQQSARKTFELDSTPAVLPRQSDPWRAPETDCPPSQLHATAGHRPMEVWGSPEGATLQITLENQDRIIEEKKTDFQPLWTRGAESVLGEWCKFAPGEIPANRLSPTITTMRLIFQLQPSMYKKCGRIFLSSQCFTMAMRWLFFSCKFWSFPFRPLCRRRKNYLK